MSTNIDVDIIKQLSLGQFVSGEALGQKLGVSRTAIANHIKQLQAMGLDIYSVKGKGYKLSQSIALLNSEQIQQHLNTAGKENYPLELHHIIDSTNSQLLRKIPHNLPKGHVCIAEYQQAGRGRRGKKWQSPFGSHVYLSIYWPLEQGMSAAMGLSLAVGIAISAVIDQYSNTPAQLKWPNDVYVGNEKIAGVLVELEGQAQGLSHCVIGVGLNVQMPENSREAIDQPWTDLSQHSPQPIDRNQLVAEIILQISHYLDIHQQHGLAHLLSQWQQRDLYINQQVKVITGEKTHLGIYRGINEQGAMILNIQGRDTIFYGGEVSLRGIK